MSKRECILETAVALFVKQGVEQTPTAQISKEAGVATGTLFHHFKNKEELIRALVLETKEEVVQQIRDHLNPDQSFREQIYAIWLAVVTWAVKNPVAYQFKSQIDAQVNIDEETQAQLDAMYQDIVTLVVSGIDDGTLKALPQDYIFHVIETQIGSAAKYLIDNSDDLDNEELRERLFQSFWDSIAA